MRDLRLQSRARTSRIVGLRRLCRVSLRTALLAAGTLLLTMTAAAAPPGPAAMQSPDLAGPVTITEVRGGLYRIDAGRQTTVCLVTDDGIVLADPLNPWVTAWLKDEFGRRFPGRAVKYVVQSTYAFDRSGGAGAFEDTAQWVGHDAYDRLLAERSHRLPPAVAGLDGNRDGRLSRDEVSDPAQAAALMRYDRSGRGTVTAEDLFSYSRAVRVRFDRRYHFTLGGQSVDLFHPPGPAPDGVITAFARQRVVFASALPPVLSSPHAFGTMSATDSMAWVAGVAAFDFDELIVGDGRVVSRAEIQALHAYLTELAKAVAAARLAGRTVADTQAQVTLTSHASTPYIAERLDHIAHYYQEIQFLKLDLQAAAGLRGLTIGSTYCANSDACDTGTRPVAVNSTVRAGLNRLVLQAEFSTGSQVSASRRATFTEDVSNLRVTRASLLFGLETLSTPRRAVTLVGGVSRLTGDVKGLTVLKETRVAFSTRQPYSVHATQRGVTGGVDVAQHAGRIALVFSGRVTRAFGAVPKDPNPRVFPPAPLAQWPGSTSVEIAAGLRFNALLRVR